MKRLFILVLMMAAYGCFAAPVWNAPAFRVQPNGDTLHCLLSGDEFYHRLHDANGYTIIQNPRTGYWVYADIARTGEERWNVVATDYVAGHVNPASVGLTPNIVVDRTTWGELQHRYDVPKGNEHSSGAKTSGRNHGTLNNIVIFIRFSDETEITTSLATINAMFNDSTSGATSMYSYFKTVSYNKIFIKTYYYPTPNGNNVISYQDSLPRSYYEPYNATTNTNGYQDDDERRTREFNLLERAVNYVNANSPIPTTLNIDMDNDGYVDNICFVVKGANGGWNDLLWPHKWSLYDRYVYINGKRVYTFNLQLEGSGSHYFSSSTFCHEMFHTLGAPDLYRYYNNTDVSGVGSWDLMCSNTTPPQQMSAYMKWKYGNWIDSIPTITIPGTYTLHSLGDNTYDNCVYKIAAQEPHQWYVLEYRDNTEYFETTLPGKGLIIFRIDDRFNGNASFDGIDDFDEVYLFRPGALNDTTNGTLPQAYFSGNTNRTQFTPTTNPYPWLTDNVIDTTIAITNITVPGTTISFTYNDLRGCVCPTDLWVHNIVSDTIRLSWSGRAPAYRLQYREESSPNVTTVELTGKTYALTGLEIDTRYKWRVQSVCSATVQSEWSDWTSFQTPACTDYQPFSVGNASLTDYTMPLCTNTPYSYVQMIYTAPELGRAIQINQIAFNYASDIPLSNKSNCVIYLGNTTQYRFADNTEPFLVPYSQLWKVYEGPFNFTQGWNIIALDSIFEYDGTSNLVVAVDDNSGIGYSINNFYCTSTGNTFSSLVYSSQTDIDPSASTMPGAKTRKKHRADIRFIGCPAAMESYIVSVDVDPASAQYGDAWFTIANDEGCFNIDTLFDGSEITLHAQPNTNIPNTVCTFTGWNDGNSDNPRTLTVTQDTTIRALFSAETIGIESVEGEVKITASGRSVIVSGAEDRKIELLDITGRILYRAAGNCIFRVPAAGVYLLRIDGLQTKKIVIK